MELFFLHKFQRTAPRAKNGNFAFFFTSLRLFQLFFCFFLCRQRRQMQSTIPRFTCQLTLFFLRAQPLHISSEKSQSWFHNYSPPSSFGWGENFASAFAFKCISRNSQLALIIRWLSVAAVLNMCLFAFRFLLFLLMRLPSLMYQHVAKFFLHSLFQCCSKISSLCYLLTVRVIHRYPIKDDWGTFYMDKQRCLMGCWCEVFLVKEKSQEGRAKRFFGISIPFFFRVKFMNQRRIYNSINRAKIVKLSEPRDPIFSPSLNCSSARCIFRISLLVPSCLSRLDNPRRCKRFTTKSKLPANLQ